MIVDGGGDTGFSGAGQGDGKGVTMDYGYQLLRHVVQQVFGNLGAAAGLTIGPIVLAIVFGTLLGFLAAVSGSVSGEAAWAGFLAFVMVLGGLAIGVLMYCWAAVGWHRYVLLEEGGNGMFPLWSWKRVRTYLTRSFLVVILILVVLVGALLAAGSLLFLVQSAALGAAINVGAAFLASWLATRIGLVLPAAALEKRMTIAESWSATRRVAGQVLLPVIAIAVTFGILGQLNGLLFAADEDTAFFLQIGNQAPRVGGMGIVVLIVLGWLQLLINLALLTTLYGNLVEGRPLN
ncbi:MAG: hypothetical protein AAF376_09390 [Pseudomonadota bacterium]